MQVLLMVHPSFLTDGARAWLDTFVHEAAARHPGVQLFQRDRHRIQDFPLLHSFGFGHFELLWNYQRLGARTLCTPHFTPPPPRGAGTAAAEIALRALRAASQRRLPPLDQFHFLRSVDRYLLRPSGECAWSRSWRLPAERTRRLASVDDLLAAYAELGGAA